MSDTTTIAVLGAGDMGHGIAELAALRGFTVALFDVDDRAVERGLARIRWSLDKLVEKQQISRPDADAASMRVKPTTKLAAAVSGAGLVIEAIPEILELKQKVLAEVEQHAPPDAILATNTSTMTIGDVGAKLKDPSRVVGMHFFNPVLLMDLVEVIPGPATSRGALQRVEDVARRMGKTTVTLKKDSPGFVTSRLVGAWIGASMLAVEHKVGSPEIIDSAMRYKAGFPMGPFELADYTGLDVNHHAATYIASKLGEGYRPSKLLAEKVQAKQLGKKTGRGFHEWTEGKLKTPISPGPGRGFEPVFILSVVANEAARILHEGVADAAAIDKAMRHGCAFPKGPLEWADETGLDRVLKALEGLHQSTKHPLTDPAPPLRKLVAEGRLGKATGSGFHAHATAGAGGPLGYETIQVATDPAAHVATVTINRPHRLNAINDQLIRDLGAAFEALDRDEAVRVIVLTGAGDKAFCAGADLQEASNATPVAAAEAAHQGHLLCLRIEKLGKPVIAAVNGVALGGGLELALPCDLRVAAKRAQLGLPEVTLGLLPAMGGTQRLPKLIGLSRAQYLALTGKRIDAATAMAWGLVHEVFDNESFADDAHRFAAEIARNAPVSLRYTKRLLNASPATDVRAGMEAEALAFGVLLSTEDVVEGVTSLFAKKKPEFKGR